MTESARWDCNNGIVTVRMSNLERPGGVRAFFTGRTGGVSQRWPGGLNWSTTVGDQVEAVAENRRRTLALLGLKPEQAVMAGLAHGTRVVAVHGDEESGPDGVRQVPVCDGLITSRPGVALVLTAADCVPVFLYDPVGRVAGVVHAGWRGTVGGIAARAVEAMVQDMGSRPADIRAQVGPSIGPCCYEVDDRVADPVRAHFGPHAQGLLSPGRAPGKYQLNLWEANRQDLLQAGIVDVAVTGACTACQVDRLFSHRGESGTAGRGAAVIVMV